MNEREFTASVSEQKIKCAISSLSLTSSFDHVSPSNAVATCTLRDATGLIVAEGAGKGSECHLGALAESVEHYAVEHLSDQHIIHCSTNEIRNQPLTKMDGLLCNLPVSDAPLECVAMADMQSGHIVSIPATLQLPNRRSVIKNMGIPGTEYLFRYSTNSGVALGCSENEAILHGLNEVIERHMLSKVLMSLCGQSEHMPLRVPCAGILADVFSNELEIHAAACHFKVLFMPTQQGVYFSMALPKSPNGRYPICPIGSGCSVDPRIAIGRAITELIQTLELYNADEKNTDLRAYSLLDRSPPLRPLIQLEKLRNVDNTVRRLDPPLSIPPAEQIELITEHLNDLGYRVLRRTLAHFGNGCFVTQVYVPGFERFNLIRAGNPVVPQRLLRANACMA